MRKPLRCYIGYHTLDEPIRFWRGRGCDGTTYRCRCGVLVDVEYDETGFRMGLPVEEKTDERAR